MGARSLVGLWGLTLQVFVNKRNFPLEALDFNCGPENWVRYGETLMQIFS